MTKQDIVRALCERLDMPKPEAQQVVQTTFDALIDSLVQEGRVELRRVGRGRHDAGPVGRRQEHPEPVALEGHAASEVRDRRRLGQEPDRERRAGAADRVQAAELPQGAELAAAVAVEIQDRGGLELELRRGDRAHRRDRRGLVGDQLAAQQVGYGDARDDRDQRGDDEHLDEREASLGRRRGSGHAVGAARSGRTLLSAPTQGST